MAPQLLLYVVKYSDIHILNYVCVFRHVREKCFGACTNERGRRFGYTRERERVE